MRTSTKTTLPTIVYLACFVIVIAGIMQIESIIKPLLMATFISVIFEKPLRWLKKKNVSNGIAVFLVVLIMFAVYFSIFQLISSSLILFSEELPKYDMQLLEIKNTFMVFMNSYGIDSMLLNNSNALDPSKIMTYTASVFGEMSDLMSSEITFLFLSVFMLAESESFHLKLKLFEKTTHTSLKHLSVISKSIRHYLSIKTATSLLTGLLISISMYLIGVDYAVLWGGLAFLLNYIPNIGSIIAAIPAMLFALISLGWSGVVWSGCAFVAVNMIIGNVVEPKIMGRGLGLSTFLIFLGLIFWGYVLGIVGMFLSVPLMMVIKIILGNNSETKWIATIMGNQEELEQELKKE